MVQQKSLLTKAFWFQIKKNFELSLNAFFISFRFHFNDLLAFIVAARWTNVVRHCVVSTVRTSHRKFAIKLMVLAGTTQTFARHARAFLWNSHGNPPGKSSIQLKNSPYFYDTSIRFARFFSLAITAPRHQFGIFQLLAQRQYEDSNRN